MNSRNIIIFFIFQLSAYAHSASFDCSVANTPNEKIICNDNELSALDDKLNVVYKTAKKFSKDPKQAITSQRQWLKDRNKCSNRECIYEKYTYRIDELSVYLFPAKSEIAEVCDFVRKPDKENKSFDIDFSKRDDDFFQYADINNDGITETIEFNSYCPSCFSAFIYDEQVDLDKFDAYREVQGEVSKLEILKYKERSYVVYLLNGQFYEEDYLPAVVTYTSADNIENPVCTFSHSYTEKPESNSDYNFCVKHENRASVNEFTGKSQLQKDDGFFKSRGPWDYFYGNTAEIDFDNDGNLEVLITVRFENVKGGGCSSTFYDLLDETRSKPLIGKKRKLLHELSSSDCSRRGTESFFFKHDGKVYIDIRSSENDQSDSKPFHFIRYVEGGKILTKCSYNYQLKIE